MEQIFVLYKRRSDVSAERFRQWSLEVDQAITPNEPGVISFAVYEVKAPDGSDAAYDYVEAIEVESFEAFSKLATESEGMKRVAAEFGDFADGDSAVVFVGKEFT